ncbi:hypothetical protein FB567DRAFT_535104 [Paraphoma chrysanthemicola]|uniref:Uncharacterized protein n=1 Tax=Paraphoma chrysanthemicola TaxID=798071 RepID=A0A8K0QY85_9PLEO|nr:hypothetical protein FB567DRAFT_535104 [Paraphoma chrysanthemicola]
MPSSKENRKFYIRSPDLEFEEGGPIQIGNVITDMFLPQDAIAILDPMPKVIDNGPAYGKGRKIGAGQKSIDFSFSAKLYHAFGGQAEARSKEAMRTIYTFDKIQPLYLESNPTAKEVKALSDKDEEVKAALEAGPIYIVTGLKIAKGLKYSNEQISGSHAGASGGGKVTENAAIQGKLSGARDDLNTETWPVIGSPIIAYRLQIIKDISWFWQSQRLNSKSLDPKTAGFMNRDESTQEADVESAEVTQEDVAYFVKEQQYKGVEGIDFDDESEDFTILCLKQ